MKKKIYNQNQAKLTGKIHGLPRVYERKGDAVTYQIRLQVVRSSKQFDIVPVLVSQDLLELMPSEYQDKTITVKGFYRSKPIDSLDKSRLSQHVAATKLEIVDDETKHENRVHATGFICKKPLLKKTNSQKEVAEVLLAINTKDASYYVPCLFWGDNAKTVAELNVGDCIDVSCRAQSRLYQKVIADGFEQRMTAYELSVYRYNVIFKSKRKKNPETE